MHQRPTLKWIRGVNVIGCKQHQHQTHFRHTTGKCMITGFPFVRRRACLTRLGILWVLIHYSGHIMTGTLSTDIGSTLKISYILAGLCIHQTKPKPAQAFIIRFEVKYMGTVGSKENHQKYFFTVIVLTPYRFLLMQGHLNKTLSLRNIKKQYSYF